MPVAPHSTRSAVEPMRLEVVRADGADAIRREDGSWEARLRVVGGRQMMAVVCGNEHAVKALVRLVLG